MPVHMPLIPFILVMLPAVLWLLVVFTFLKNSRKSKKHFKKEWIGKTFKFSKPSYDRVDHEVLIYERNKNRFLNLVLGQTMKLVKNVSDLPVEKRSTAYDSFTVDNMPDSKSMVNITLPDGKKGSIHIIHFYENDFRFEEIVCSTNKAITQEEDPLARFNKLKEANFVFAKS